MCNGVVMHKNGLRCVRVVVGPGQLGYILVWMMQSMMQSILLKEKGRPWSHVAKKTPCVRWEDWRRRAVLVSNVFDWFARKCSKEWKGSYFPPINSRSDSQKIRNPANLHVPWRLHKTLEKLDDRWGKNTTHRNYVERYRLESYGRV